MSEYNLAQYNLLGYNISSASDYYLKITFSVKVDNTVITIVNNAYPKARLYEAINKGILAIVPGRFVSALASTVVQKTKASMIGCSWRKVTAAEIVKAKVICLGYFWKTATGNETVDAKAAILGCSWQAVEYAETVECIKADVLGYFWQRLNLAENILADIKHSCLVKIPVTARENVNGTLHQSIIANLSPSLNEIVDKQIILSTELFLKGEVSNLINAICDAENNEILICNIDVTLEPGDVLIIDADTYNVWINQENAIYTHSGDWIDELVRNTRNLSIRADSGESNIEATVLYTERFL